MDKTNKPPLDNAVPKVASPLPLEQELEHLSRLLHGIQPPLDSPAAEALVLLARRMHGMVDPLTCILRSSAFLRQIETEVYRVRRGRAELSLVCFSLHDKEDITLQHGPEALQMARQALVLSLKEYTLPCDCIGFTDSGHPALLLPGAGAFKAQAQVEKILKECAGQGLRTPCGAFMPHFLAGIACATGGHAQAETLVREAVAALENAPQAHNFCAVFRETSVSNLYQTLVHSNEKRFLFSGGQ